MARIVGVDLPKNKRGEIGLTYIYGIGRSRAAKILTDVLAKSKGSSNPHNLVKATFKALSLLRDVHAVSQFRGVDINTVFNG